MLCRILTLLMEIRIMKNFRQSCLKTLVPHMRKVGVDLLTTV